MSFDPDAPALEGAGIYGLPHTPDEAAVVLVPVPWEATTSYRPGTARGPAAILEASRQVDLFDVETGRPYLRGVAMLPEDPEIVAWNHEARLEAEKVIAAGGVIRDADLARSLKKVNVLGERLNRRVRQTAEAWLGKGKIVGVVGGDHSTPLGLIEAVAERHPGLGILHVDAHADLRRAYEGFTWSHASIMYNVAELVPGIARIVQVGIRDLGEAEWAYAVESQGKIETFHESVMAASRLIGETFADQTARMLAPLPAEVYLSVDIDGLDPAYCPHTGTPVPGGLSFQQACFLIAAVVKSGRRIVGFDLNEVAPGPDGDEWDANVGARLLYKMIGWALKSAEEPERV